MAGADRAKSLEAVMAQIEKAHGKGAVMRLGDEVRVPVDGDTNLVAEPHHCALAVCLLDLRHHCLKRLRAICSSHVPHLPFLYRGPPSTCDRHLCGDASRVESDVTSDHRQPHPSGAGLCKVGQPGQPMGKTLPEQMFDSGAGHAAIL